MLAILRIFGFLIPVAHWYVAFLYIVFSDFALGALLVLPVMLVVEIAAEYLLGKAQRFGPEGLVDPKQVWNVYTTPLILSGISQAVFIAWGMMEFLSLEGEAFKAAALLVLVGFTNGSIGFTVAHELMHRPSRFLQWCSSFILLTMCLPTYKLEHVYGHHVDAGTPDDGSWAPRGRGFYIFFPRAVYKNFLKGWKLGVKLSVGRTGLFTKLNELIAWYVVLFGIIVALWMILGIWAVLFFVGQAVVSSFVLELINYVQHYGLGRQLMENGKYEPFDDRHSWDTDNNFPNMMLLNLPRHSDHHLRPHKDYIGLNSTPSSPQLPYGFVVASLMALIPPLWCRVMDAEIDKYGRLSQPSQVGQDIRTDVTAPAE